MGVGADIKKGAMKIHAHIKGALKVKAPKVKGSLKVKAPKDGLKVKAGGKAKDGAKAKVGGKASLKVKAPKLKVGGKASLKVKAKKDRRLQKATTTTEPTMTTGKDGLSLDNYTKDVAVPKDLSGDADQTAPASSNLLKLAFMTFAMIMTMF